MKPVTTDLSKLSDLVKNEVIKKRCVWKLMPLILPNELVLKNNSWC